MSGESNLQILLKNMMPMLKEDPYVFLTAENFTLQEQQESVMVFKESEGQTLIMKESAAKNLQKQHQGTWALITLNVHSNLNAIGFLAAITEKLAKAGISVNAVSAFYHDHLFVPWEKKENAMSLLSDFTEKS